MATILFLTYYLHKFVRSVASLGFSSFHLINENNILDNFYVKMTLRSQGYKVKDEEYLISRVFYSSIFLQKIRKYSGLISVNRPTVLNNRL